MLPKADAEATLRFDLAAAPALAQLHAWGAKPLPLDASAWWNDNLVVRLRGSSAAVEEATRALGGEAIAQRFQLTDRATDGDDAGGVEGADAGGVVAAVFEAREALNEDGFSKTMTDVTDDAAHDVIPLMV